MNEQTSATEQTAPRTRQTAINALEAAERCVDVCVKELVANTNAFTNAWALSRDALHEETLTPQARGIIRQIVLNVLASATEVRKSALKKARSKIKANLHRADVALEAALQKAEVEKRQAVESAIKERKASERVALALFLCVVSGVALYFSSFPYSSIAPLAFALYVLKFRRPIKTLADLNPFATFSDIPK